MIDSNINSIVRNSDSGIYYCSAGSESSIEDGSVSNPFKTLENAARVVPDGATLLLERGYEYPFFGQFNSRAISFGAYGYGNDPVVSRFVKIRNVNGNLFSKDPFPANVWAINFGVLLEQSGVDESQLANIAFIYNPYTDKIVFGHKVAFCYPQDMVEAFDYQQPTQGQLQAYTFLERDGDFYQNAAGKIMKVYSTVDPNVSDYPEGFNVPSFGDDSRATQELWFATGGSFIVHPRNCTIRDIKIAGFGRHAIEGGMSNVRIDNVTVDLVGGMTQNPSDVGTKNFVRIGNGIEVWCSIQIPTKNVSVENCAVSRVFDSGMTLQGVLDSHELYGADNIVFRNNWISNCRTSFESFIYYSKEGGGVEGIAFAKNCRFIFNKAYNAGENGFNSPGPMDAHIASVTPGLEIADCYFYNGNFMSRFTESYGSEMGAGNICHIQPGQYLLQESTDSRKYIYYPENPDATSVAEAVGQYRAKNHDYHTMFVGIDSIVSSSE